MIEKKGQDKMKDRIKEDEGLGNIKKNCRRPEEM